MHPDDNYAQNHHGKLGKNECWVILSCEPGARLYCGLKEGVRPEQIGHAILQEESIEPLLRSIQIQAGDVIYIPAGTVHAIGGGILLYELQQSSDLTYRLFLDWGCRDAAGKKRQLHLQQALDVMKTASRPEPLNARWVKADGHGKRELLLETPYFELFRLTNCTDFPISPDKERFSALQPYHRERFGGKAERLFCKQGRPFCCLRIDSCCHSVGSQRWYAAPGKLTPASFITKNAGLLRHSVSLCLVISRFSGYQCCPSRRQTSAGYQATNGTPEKAFMPLISGVCSRLASAIEQSIPDADDAVNTSTNVSSRPARHRLQRAGMDNLAVDGGQNPPHDLILTVQTERSVPCQVREEVDERCARTWWWSFPAGGRGCFDADDVDAVPEHDFAGLWSFRSSRPDPRRCPGSRFQASWFLPCSRLPGPAPHGP